MDDVLASIRRIVRAEKDPDSVQDAQTLPTETTAPPPEPEAAEEGAPLALTPDMLMAEETAAAMAEPVSDVVEAAETIQETASDAMAIDPDMVRDMVRETVMEQLNGPDADALIRKVIRDELVTGDVGSNISKNVLRLIRTEIESSLAK